MAQAAHVSSAPCAHALAQLRSRHSGIGRCSFGLDGAQVLNEYPRRWRQRCAHAGRTRQGQCAWPAHGRASSRTSRPVATSSASSAAVPGTNASLSCAMSRAVVIEFALDVRHEVAGLQALWRCRAAPAWRRAWRRWRAAPSPPAETAARGPTTVSVPASGGGRAGRPGRCAPRGRLRPPAHSSRASPVTADTPRSKRSVSTSRSTSAGSAVTHLMCSRGCALATRAAARATLDSARNGPAPTLSVP